MNPRPDEVEALARAIDRIVFPERGDRRPEGEASAETIGLVSYLNDSFPRMTLAAARRDRVNRRVARALGLPRLRDAGLTRFEAEMNRRLGNVDRRWAPVFGGTALVLLGVVGFAVWRQRGSGKPAVAGLR